MGAFGSCLGVGRPAKPGANARLLTPNLISVDNSPFGPSSANARSIQMRLAPPIRQNCFSSNGASPNVKGPIPKLMRQSSSLSSQQPFNHHNSPSQNVPKLVDIDDNPSPFDKPIPNSHLIRSQQQQQQQQQQVNNIADGSVEARFLNCIRSNPNEMKLLIALYDYIPRTADDLEFRKGEHMETCKSLMVGEWWLARSKSTKGIGYVPCNYVAELKTLGAEPWYLGRIGRAEAELRLKLPENNDGAFIIRDSDTTQSRYSLSLRHGTEVKHYRIKQFDTGGFYINKKTVFSTIHDLVLHYSNAADGLCINLKEPCVSRFDKPATIGLSHDTENSWEINRNELTLLEELGHGQFGQVFRGLYKNNIAVAIKTLRKGSMEPQEFLAEAQIMKQMKDDNLVRLFAVCTKEEPVYIITELMSKGALSTYLQTPEGKKLELPDLIKMSAQIASGMSYLEREKYVHRDLAARNILVGDKNVCKIADFGLARFIKETEYEARAGARFPIKWTAPEAANYSKFTIKSDVWSFGIVLYEIITKGGTPYPDMTNADVLNRIDKGYRMPQPPGCDRKYYGIMIECWNKEPNKRPTFETLHWKLNDYFISDEQYKDASHYRGK